MAPGAVQETCLRVHETRCRRWWEENKDPGPWDGPCPSHPLRGCGWEEGSAPSTGVGLWPWGLTPPGASNRGGWDPRPAGCLNPAAGETLIAQMDMNRMRPVVLYVLGPALSVSAAPRCEGGRCNVLICVCASSCDDWKYVLSLATGWTWGRGGAAASLLPGSWIQHVYYIQMHIRIIYSLKYTSTHIFISLYKYKPACIRKANIKHSKMWRIVSREGLERKRWLPQYFVRTEPNSQDDGDLAGTKTVLQFDIKVPPAQHQTCYGKALINQS